MEVTSALEQWRYQQRVLDAESYSRQLVKEFPVSLAKPSPLQAPLAASNDRNSASHQSNRFAARATTRESYRHLLQSVDADDYGTRALVSSKLWEKEDPLRALRKNNLELTRRLKNALQSRERRDARPALKLDKRSGVNGFTQRFGRKARAIEPYGLKTSSKPKLMHHDEIEELKARLAKARLDRVSDDSAFYDRVAQRETNELVAEVADDELWDLLVDVYEEAVAATRKRELPPEQLQIVQTALHDGPANQVLIQKYQVDLTRRHLQCLLPLQWLNDEVINFWFQMLADRDAALVKRGDLAKGSHFFNSFFYTKVSEGGYNFINVRRWTRKVDLFAMDKIFVPVNISNTHWCLAVIFMTDKRIQYYDSMDGSGQRCLEVLLKYLHDEMEHKKKQAFDASDWRLVQSTPDTPQQENGSDCGVFACTFADYLSRNLPLTCKQKDMEFHRHRMALHIVQGELPLDDDEDDS
ncbi:hypothetical protein PINS_up007847 [Pythium insidiosum]|nr:hypothetical protein PINS_up007847 [Pythium insidiosum]